ncbi:General transcription factor II-I repeat domain-containing protein 2-like [Oopsacas minuta]|uniref:General transcription factor II-I repeat domain-containing protein 2-like n=1 Tax=Oopsacas minuta TaxID=111878 RepID=A0AAV7JFF6_9METZ|nr:General transcription factor II-I repeat domain-containing protein 2-like [Oopsacas minuta]
MSESEKKALAEKQTHSLLKQQQVFTTQTRFNEAVTRASFVVAHKIAQDCLLACSDILCPKETKTFDCVSLSRRTITRRVEEISADLHGQVKDECRDCICFSLALDESTDTKDTAQLLIFIRTIDFNFKILEELASMEPLKSTTTGTDLLKAVNVCIGKLGISWDKLVSVTTDSSPNLKGKHIGLLKKLQDQLHIENPDQNIIFLHCIIHQHALCKSALGLTNVSDVVTKVVNYIKARGLNHRQFQAFLRDMEAPYADVPYHTKAR